MSTEKISVEKIRPLRGQVLVQPEPWKDRRTSGGLYVPTTAREKGIRAKVLAVGPGKYLDNGLEVDPGVRVGDRVLVCEYNAMLSTGNQAVGDNAVPQQLVHQDDIRGVIETEEVSDVLAA